MSIAEPAHAPLEGQRILITRPEGQAAQTQQAIRELGGTPLLLPMIRITIATLSTDKSKQYEPLSHFQWIVFTSANAVAGFLKNLKASLFSLPSEERPLIAAVGKQTAKTLHDRGLKIDFQPDKATGQALGLQLPLQNRQPVLFPCGDQARQTLPNTLRERGIPVEPVMVYHNTALAYSRKAFNETLAQKPHAIVFTSPSTVNAFFQHCQQYELWPEHSVIIACIGATTGEAVKQWGLDPHLIPAKPGTEALLQALSERLSSLRA